MLGNGVNPVVETEKTNGNLAFKEGRFAQAVQHFSAAIAVDSSNPVLYSNRSGAYASLAQYTEALADAERATDLQPTWPRGYSRKAAALYGLGRYAAAISTYDAGLQVEPSNPQMLQARSDVAAKLEAARGLIEAAFVGDLARVRELLEQGVHPDGYETEEGNTALLLACQSGSADLVRELVAYGANPSQRNQANQNATSLMRSSGHEELLKLLPDERTEEKVFSGASNLFAAVRGAAAAVGEAVGGAAAAAMAKGGEGSAEGCRDASEYAAEAQMMRAPTAEEREQMADKFKRDGNEAFKVGNFHDAVKLYTQAVELCPNSNVLYSNRSGALAAIGAYEQALADAERCVALSPDWCKGHTRKASALHGLKRFLDAIRSYDTALKYEPTNDALMLGRRQSSFALALES